MRIVEWNCQGAFRKKNKNILALNPDILIIPECENEQKLEFGKLTPKQNDFFWYSSSGNKGIGIFSYSDYKFELLKEFNPKFRYIIPLKVESKNDSFLLFAVWAMDNKENKEARYIAQVWLALKYYSRLLKLNSILIGDFNSNKIWDEKDRIANHTDVVEDLKSNNIFSIYHEQNKMAHGQEKEHTFFMYRKIEKRYHIDYCFASKNFLNEGSNVELGNPNDWIELSDHVPLIIQTSKLKKHIDFNNSLSDSIKYKSEQLNTLTIKKFSSTIEKLKSRAKNSDLNDFSNKNQSERIKIIEVMEKLLEIDKHIQEFTKNDFH